MIRRPAATLAAILCVLSLVSCGDVRRGPAVIWTDAPELAFYAELFNAAQTRYRMDVQWKADLAATIRDATTMPDLAMGRYLKSAAARDRFQSLDYLFGELTVNQASFYPSLLALGSTGGRQLLLPVSFDLPAIVYVQGGTANPGNKYVLGLEDLAGPSAAWNQKKNGSFVKMGFSPRWDPDFLVHAVSAYGAGFREGRPISWSESGLDSAVGAIRSWCQAANGSASAEDDFQFKYLYTPAYKYIVDGRALYATMQASALFLVPEEKRTGLDFRWFAENGAIPVTADVVYAAIPRAAKDKSAAEAFLKWFYREDSQRQMLENARLTRSIEASFGIAGGFSAERPVTEKVFPLYYPGLVGHLPPAEALAAPNALPNDWPEIQAKVVAPWLVESCAKPKDTEGRPGEELAARLADWGKNQGQGR